MSTSRRAKPPQTQEFVLENESLAWCLDWRDGKLRSVSLSNKLSGHTFALSEAQEVALNFSATTDRVQEPLVRADDFEVVEARPLEGTQAVFRLSSPSIGIEALLHFQLEGPTRRKWVEVHNKTGSERLLLDVELDSFDVAASTEGGGQGQPLFIAEEAFAALEHPSGENRGERGQVRLFHYPGTLMKPGARFKSHVALVSVAKPGEVLEHFISYIDERSVRKKKALSVYTPFGINNQWGLCPTLDDEQALDMLDLLERWQKKGVRFDYLTLDTGWVDPNSDLTRFKPTCYPNGPEKITERVKALGMKLGLWFATSWAAESCWDYPPAWERQQAPPMSYLNGVPSRANFHGSFCMGCEPYVKLLQKAVLYHLEENHVRFLKFDGGNYYCDSTEHGHLPGKYSVERMHESLIEIANRARAAAPDVFILWYWGLRSPFWALHGDAIFESGLHMEGSGTSSSPTLYYRDSVTLAQDQNAQHARTIPALAKDSLGVWLADTRWGNFMGKERWKEALVMDLGRGSLLFPNLWGNLYHLTDEEVEFLAWISSFAKKNESVFLQRKRILGDPWKNEVYGYAHFKESRGFLFLNNAHFASREARLQLDSTIGLQSKPGTPVHILSHFPDRRRLLRNDGSRFSAGDTVKVWLRPFEVLMLEVTTSARSVDNWPQRSLSERDAANLGVSLRLQQAPLDESMSVQFVEGPHFEQLGLRKKTYSFRTTRTLESARALESALPGNSPGETAILAVTVRLRAGEAEWRYSPVVAEIVQAVARLGEQNLQLIPVPEARQFGNTQKAGCSWVLYKVRLSPQWSGKTAKIAVTAYLPEEVEARVEAWVVRRWWEENARPMGDGYYGDAPS
ncbi:MAG: hypothetical protein HY318_20705 [Armatimonadetes bacterium]|nr:hypothetical protein [Armatimonadota bacterium]